MMFCSTSGGSDIGFCMAVQAVVSVYTVLHTNFPDALSYDSFEGPKHFCGVIRAVVRFFVDSSISDRMLPMTLCSECTVSIICYI